MDKIEPCGYCTTIIACSTRFLQLKCIQLYYRVVLYFKNMLNIRSDISFLQAVNFCIAEHRNSHWKFNIKLVSFTCRTALYDEKNQKRAAHPWKAPANLQENERGLHLLEWIFFWWMKQSFRRKNRCRFKVTSMFVYATCRRAPH